MNDDLRKNVWQLWLPSSFLTRRCLKGGWFHPSDINACVPLNFLFVIFKLFDIFLEAMVRLVKILPCLKLFDKSEPIFKEINSFEWITALCDRRCTNTSDYWRNWISAFLHRLDRCQRMLFPVDGGCWPGKIDSVIEIMSAVQRYLHPSLVDSSTPSPQTYTPYNLKLQTPFRINLYLDDYLYPSSSPRVFRPLHHHPIKFFGPASFSLFIISNAQSSKLRQTLRVS